MDDLFYKKVKAAAISGWWTLLVAVALLLFATAGFLALSQCKPAWVPKMMGGVSWETIQQLGLWMIGAYRVMIWLMFLAVVWLSLWSVRLKKIQ